MKDFKRNCHHCGSEYRNVYKTGGAYNTPYTIETKYCSKSCAQLAKSRTPDELIVGWLLNNELLLLVTVKVRV